MDYCEPNVAKRCKLTEMPMNRQIYANSDPTHEGHPTLLCGNLINHIVEDIKGFAENTLQVQRYFQL